MKSRLSIRWQLSDIPGQSNILILNKETKTWNLLIWDNRQVELQQGSASFPKSSINGTYLLDTPT
jgi:hypothetical protein